MSRLYLDVCHDDDGCVVRMTRGGSIGTAAIGVAMHAGLGQAETFRRALADLKADLRRRNTKPASLPQRLDAAARSLKEP